MAFRPLAGALVIPVAALLVVATLNLPSPPVYGTLPIGVGSFTLPNKEAFRGDTYYWMQFNFTINASRAYRLIGAWRATQPTWVTFVQAESVWDGIVEHAGDYQCIAPAGQSCYSSPALPLNGTLDEYFPPYTFSACFWENGSWASPQVVLALLFESSRPDTITVEQPILVQEVAYTGAPVCPVPPPAS